MPNAADPLQAMLGCPPPVWMNTATAKQPDGICVHYTGPSRCKEPAVHWAWIGCTIGEHLDKSGVCGEHAASISRVPALHCLRCWNALRIISDAKVIKIERIPDGD